MMAVACTHQPILLSYVAGKDGPTGPVRATVEIETPTPTEWHFNCPPARSAHMPCT